MVFGAGTSVRAAGGARGVADFSLRPPSHRATPFQSVDKRLEEAKLRLDAAHEAVQEGLDGHHALREAVTEYIKALNEAAGPDPTLSPREREVLRLIAAGKSSREIAAELGIAFKTVVVHRHKLYRKLKIHKSVDLVRAAMGLV